jgi:hypothetical protein
MPELDVFPPDMPMSAVSHDSLQLSKAVTQVATTSTVPLVDVMGHVVDVDLPCNETARYSIELKLVWTNKTHPDYPLTGTAWSPVSVALHDGRSVLRAALTQNLAQQSARCYCLPFSMHACMLTNQVSKAVEATQCGAACLCSISVYRIGSTASYGLSQFVETGNTRALHKDLLSMHGIRSSLQMHSEICGDTKLGQCIMRTDVSVTPAASRFTTVAKPLPSTDW